MKGNRVNRKLTMLSCNKTFHYFLLRPHTISWMNKKKESQGFETAERRLYNCFVHELKVSCQVWIWFKIIFVVKLKPHAHFGELTFCLKHFLANILRVFFYSLACLFQLVRHQDLCSESLPCKIGFQDNPFISVQWQRKDNANLRFSRRVKISDINGN